MLGLGTGTQYPSSLSLVKLVVGAVATDDTDDENVAVTLATNDVATQNALLDGISQSTGAKVNGTVALTVENHDTLGSNSHRIGTKTFNVFQFANGNSQFYFLSTAASDITISSADDYKAVDLTVATFLDSGGSDANLDAAGSGEVYDFDAVLSITGFADSAVVVQDSISIDAA